MTTLTIAGFRGANLAANPRLLPDTVGTSMVDAEPGRGDLRALHELLTTATVPTSPQRQTIYRMGRDTPSDSLYWLSWSARVDVARGFDADDPTERTYFSGSGSPKWTSNAIGLGSTPYPQATRELAVPAPISAPTVALDTDGTDGTESTIFYVSTFVNDLGWESAPSPPSTGLTMKPGAVVDITDLESAPSGNYGITLRRIYRTQADATGEAEFYFLREVAIGTTDTTDDARALGGLLATAGWIPPPDDAFGLIALWNGMFALCSGKTAHFSEPYSPYAYPVRYDISVADTPVATAKWEQNFLILTTGRPVLIQGQDPAGMSDSPLSMVMPCRAARSVASFGHGVVWASAEGLAYAGSNGQLLLTGPSTAAPEGILTPRQWKALDPDSMIAGRWGRFYACSFDDGGEDGRRGFLFDPLNPAGGITWLSFGWDACWYDELADELFVLQGGNVRKFDAGDDLLTAGFVSKRFMQTKPINFAWFKVVATNYPVSLTITARWRDPGDGTQRTHTENRTVTSDRALALQAGFLADDWQVSASCAGTIEALRLSTDVRELRGA